MLFRSMDAGCSIRWDYLKHGACQRLRRFLTRTGFFGLFFYHAVIIIFFYIEAGFSPCRRSAQRSIAGRMKKRGRLIAARFSASGKVFRAMAGVAGKCGRWIQEWPRTCRLAATSSMNLRSFFIRSVWWRRSSFSFNFSSIFRLFTALTSACCR